MFLLLFLVSCDAMKPQCSPESSWRDPLCPCKDYAHVISGDHTNTELTCRLGQRMETKTSNNQVVLMCICGEENRPDYDNRKEK